MATGLPQSSFECSICFELLLDPVVLSCGHDACKCCLETWKATQRSSQPLRCPLCRGAALPDNLGVCVRLRDTVEALFPDKVAARRREVAKAAERAKQELLRQQQQRQQQQQQLRQQQQPQQRQQQPVEARPAGAPQQAALRAALQAAMVNQAILLTQQPQAPAPPVAAVLPTAAVQPTISFSAPPRRQGTGGGNAGSSGGHQQPHPPPVASAPAPPLSFSFFGAPAASSLGQQPAAGGAPFWGAAPAHPPSTPLVPNVFAPRAASSSAGAAPNWGFAPPSTGGAGSSTGLFGNGRFPALWRAAAAAAPQPPAPAPARQAVAGEAWPLQQVAFTMGWYERRAPRGRRCRPRGERRQNIRSRVRA